MKYYDDFQIGDKIATRARTVTEADVVNFATLTGDFHPLHVDAEYARKGPYGERIAHGMLTLSLATGFWSPEYTLQWALIAFYGMDSVRFLLPVRIGDTIHVEFEVIDKRDKNERTGVLHFKQTVINHREEAVASGVIKILVGKE